MAPGRFSGDKWMHFQYVSTLLVDAVERGLLPVGAVVSACGTGTGSVLLGSGASASSSGSSDS